MARSRKLIDATTGRHVWVERFDRGLEDVFKVQDEVSRKLVGSLVGKLDRATTEMAMLKQLPFGSIQAASQEVIKEVKGSFTIGNGIRCLYPAAQ